ncbi:LytTR family two component transcriptional regulator [Mucilaginibacter oryzae]|uniref:LytTR family two component transcriptional regulator n=1 Tax=Mucilaginibacter oryzae TaxID=468058 RepID=A0A316H1A3_9SPHI|nr:LytTR family DNA-binding domain-containing protein [Mucilaginibacter oryzae]PWK72907.1 LytTR family two component transcriptional regulator [Mucilaginibacter oryzae]
MTLTTYIVDDEAHAIDYLAAFIRKTPDLVLAGSDTDPVKALHDLKANPPMLVFLDVEMPALSGLDLASLIGGDIKVVLVTSFRQYGPEAFALKICDYLMKPFSYARFLECIQKVRDLYELKETEIKEREHLFVKGGQKDVYIKVPVNAILYARSAINYVEIQLADERIITYLTLTELMENLPAGQFSRVQRSHIVNRDRIRAIEQSDIRMENGELIPIGESYREEFMSTISPSLLISKRIRG